MATIEHEHVSNWLELTLLIDGYFTHYNDYIFRGQADSDWKLEPSITRALKSTYKNAADRNRVIESHKNQFKENIRGRVSFNLSSASDEEIWSLGQHFGLHTPLLDWTLSPYVALFFSLFGPCNSGKRALWAVVKNDIEMIRKKKSRSQKDVYIVNPLTHYNERLVSQRGLFLNIPTNVDLEKWVDTGEDQNWVTMYKITFPDSIRSDALSALNNRNINHLSLFPDVHGSSLYTNYMLEIEPYLEHARNNPPWE
jgi:hypothetical protein